MRLQVHLWGPYMRFRFNRGKEGSGIKQSCSRCGPAFLVFWPAVFPARWSVHPTNSQNQHVKSLPWRHQASPFSSPRMGFSGKLPALGRGSILSAVIIPAKMVSGQQKSLQQLGVGRGVGEFMQLRQSSSCSLTSTPQPPQERYPLCTDPT